MYIDPDVVQNVLLIGAGILSWYLAFRSTPDLDAVDNALRRFMYRAALLFFYMDGLVFLIEALFALITKVAE